MGLQMPLTNCSKTAPTAISDASVTMHVSAAGTGWLRRVA